MYKHCSSIFAVLPQNADLLKGNAKLKELSTAQANALKQRDQKIAELEEQLLAKQKPWTSRACQREV